MSRKAELPKTVRLSDNVIRYVMRPETAKIHRLTGRAMKQDRVPVFRGVSARMMNEMRADFRRSQRLGHDRVYS